MLGTSWRAKWDPSILSAFLFWGAAAPVQDECRLTIGVTFQRSGRLSETVRGRIKNERFDEKGIFSILNSNDLCFWYSYRSEGVRNR